MVFGIETNPTRRLADAKWIGVSEGTKGRYLARKAQTRRDAAAEKCEASAGAIDFPPDPAAGAPPWKKAASVPDFGNVARDEPPETPDEPDLVEASHGRTSPHGSDPNTARGYTPTGFAVATGFASAHAGCDNGAALQGIPRLRRDDKRAAHRVEGCHVVGGSRPRGGRRRGVPKAAGATLRGAGRREAPEVSAPHQCRWYRGEAYVRLGDAGTLGDPR